MKVKIITILREKWEHSKFKTIADSLKSLSLTEKVIFNFLVLILILSGLNLLWSFSKNFMAEVPTSGGSLSEGIIGTSRYINPVLAISDADRDLTSLFYSGLLKYDSSGDLVNDLAESYDVSSDGTVYTFTIRPNARFHDGTLVTSNDIEFTIQETLDPAVKSPKLANWKGVKVQKVNDQKIQFVLPQPYPPFLSNLTMGILPKHIWKDLSAEEFPFSQFNTEPIGSGPYKFQSLTRNKSGVASYYTLKAFSSYALGEPYITDLTVHFYSNEKNLQEAFKNGEIQSLSGLSPQNLLDLEKNKTVNIERIPLSHIYAFFLNQNQNRVFTNKEIRVALDESLDRDQIIKESLAGYGKKLYSPIPADLLPINYLTGESSTTTIDIEGIKNDLAKAGWKTNKDGILEKTVKKDVYQFTFSIATLNTPELSTAAEVAKAGWEKIGAKVDLKLFEFGDLNQNIIHPRKYDVLLFGEVVGRDLDFYGYWHSSQRNYPGLNLAQYANNKVDKILEDARKVNDKETRTAKYLEFEKEIKNDIPAIFAYSHEFFYILPTQVKNFQTKIMTTPSERFLNIQDWYIETENIWKVFEKINNR